MGEKKHLNYKQPQDRQSPQSSTRSLHHHSTHTHTHLRTEQQLVGTNTQHLLSNLIKLSAELRLE